MFISVENILALMEKQGLNARQFEIKLGLSNGSVQGWKKGKFSPSAKALQKIADYFELPLDYFYKDNTSAPTHTHEEERTLSEEEQRLIDLILSLTDEEVAELSKFVDYIISKRK